MPPKKDDRHNPSNYRPIALLSVVGKIFERLIHRQIHNYLLENKLLYKLQSGFLPNNSTVYQLIEIYHEICINRELKKDTGFVFCDVSKAFDRVWHAGLLKKLRAYGITGTLYSLIENYLSGRQQSVFVNNSFSDFAATNAGVPQGSVLGPLLFLIFINDIADKLLSISRLFADDTSMSATSQDKTELETILNTDLSTLLQWSKLWKVTFNPANTEVLYIGYSGNDPVNLTFDGNPLNVVNSHKHLGVTLMSNGKWSEHIERICKSAYKQVNVLRKLKYTLSRATLNKIYTTFILPTLEYASEVWDGCTLADSERLEKVQFEAARIVTGLPSYASRESLLFESGWELLKERRERKKLITFYKIHHNIAPDFLVNIISPLKRENVRNLRNQNDYTLRNDRLESTRVSYFPSTIRLWNNLEFEIRNNFTFNQFKYYLNTLKDVHRVPEYFNVGKRKTNIILTKLRNSCSSLNSDLFRVNLVNSPVCSCGYFTEDVVHFMLFCPNYQRQRIILRQKLDHLQPLDLPKLLFGDELLSQAANKLIMISVQEYIHASGRFL